MTLPVVIIFVLLALTSLPIGIGSGIASAIALHFGVLPKPLLMLMQRMVYGIDSFTLLAVPLFILCGRLMNTAGITDRIFNFAQVLVGHIPGGLAHANVVASMIFAGMSGSAIADAGGLGQVEIKAMCDQGYRKEFAVAVTAASATIGPIIPPSVSMILYAAIAEESIGKLFLGGFIPGVMMGIVLMIQIYFMAIRRNYPKNPKQPLSVIWHSFKKAILPILTPSIIIGGIAGGIFTVTEAAAVAAFYAWVLGGIIYKEVKFRDLPAIFIDTMKTTAVMMFILSTIGGVSWILVTENITDYVARAIFSVTKNPTIILLMINIFLIMFGCVLEAAPIMVLTIPIFVPLIKQIGLDPVHFGVVMVLNLMIGLITPPVGMILFVITEISGLQIEKLMRSIIPFILPLIIVLLLITLFPPLVLTIPNWLMP
ncbi:MAG: TRAP transporter large permease [Deltaproteobacteria bacterium]|nr:TRAP transporter large permease [Deltaproteobacteria bacterium]MBW2153106.1 TRAP transporter large permease [Deltaproteobacteria bacterium]